jgi:dipeptidyl aminopeptidase/acylaminoacyl peptidase
MKRIILICSILLISKQLLPQEKRSLTFDDIIKWNHITERVISDDGTLVAFTTEPWTGDPVVTLYDNNAIIKASFPCATGINITPDSRFLIFTIKTPEEKVKELKLKKTKKDDMPADMLGIYNITGGVTDTVARMKSFKVPKKWAGWIAWQTEPVKEKPASPKDTSDNGNENHKKPKSESAENGYTLFIRNLNSGQTDTVKFVTEYIFGQEAEMIMYATTGNNPDTVPEVVLLDLKKGVKSVLYLGKAKYKQLAVDKKGERAAFILSFDEKDKAGNTWSLCYWNGKGLAVMAATGGTQGIPEGWIINENSPLTFAEKSPRLFFGTSPAYKIKDTTMLDEDRPNVDVWHYSEGKLHSAQVVSKARDLKKHYMAVYHTDLKKTVQLATTEIPDIQLIDKGDAKTVVAVSNLPYELESMWEGDPRYDVWLVDMITGLHKKIKENCRARIRVSQAGKYLYWYQGADSSWYSYNLKEKHEIRLTTPATLAIYNEENDVPDLPGSYPAYGWLKDDKAFLVSDRYDIWSLDPDAVCAPLRVTTDGRERKTRYSLLDFDTENDFIDPAEEQYLMGTDEVNRGDAFYSIDLEKQDLPVKLTSGNFNLGTPVKARKSDVLIFTKENFWVFPDYLVSDLSFATVKRITDANPQQKDFLWGEAEVVRWVSLDGREIEGLLYKPEGFDPGKKYPMIVNFYERSSSELYRHRIPEPGRSTIDYHYYTSNGYLVFSPDVFYTEGYPGQSAYNCVMPGIMSLIGRGFVDEKHIGAQGHSWGGYQVAYLATRTTLFAAIESGAPVVNMFSAYGGIRWESGLNRSMQYEHEQSRIGATIWEASQRYWENSPLFAADKIETPILIMANDQDGAVPWYQGIEFFVALRRLGKPAWLLNYNGEPHWVDKAPNKKDFQMRMAQFFAHYLKGEPMPEWMAKGIPATEKDFILEY